MTQPGMARVSLTGWLLESFPDTRGEAVVVALVRKWARPHWREGEAPWRSRLCRGTQAQLLGGGAPQGAGAQRVTEAGGEQACPRRRPWQKRSGQHGRYGQGAYACQKASVPAPPSTKLFWRVALCRPPEPVPQVAARTWILLHCPPLAVVSLALQDSATSPRHRQPDAPARQHS